MLAGTIPDAWVYQKASRLIEEHGDDALLMATQLGSQAALAKRSIR